MSLNSQTSPSKKRICILGSGAWGSVIARIIARNVMCYRCFYPRVTMWVYEEFIGGRKLTDIINTEHENIKYAPGFKFTRNLVAFSNIVEAARNADILIFVLPHQFVDKVCRDLFGKIKKGVTAISLIKGFQEKYGGGIELISHAISRKLEIPCHVLMGANIATEIALEKSITNSTLGCKNKSKKRFFKKLFETRHFQITVVDDEDTVEVCGALKNIVATGAGFLDGLDVDNRYKEAIIRIGFIEMIRFVDIFYPGGKLSTFFESCGIEDLVVTSYAGRNRRCAEAFIRTGRPLEDLERDMLNGQKLQGLPTAELVNSMLRTKNMSNQFPLFTVIEEVGFGRQPPSALLECVDKNFNKHIYIPKTIRPS